MSLKIAGLAILTTCMFAFSIYLQNGIWLFPFGLFKIGLFIVTIIVLVNQRKRFSLIDGLLVVWTGFLALSSHFVFEFFVREQTFETNNEFLSGISSLLFFVFTIGFFVWQILIAFQSENWRKWLQLVSAIALFVCFLSNEFVWIIIPTLIWLIAIYRYSKISEVSQAVGILFTFIVVSSWISGCFFGLERVLGNL